MSSYTEREPNPPFLGPPQQAPKPALASCAARGARGPRGPYGMGTGRASCLRQQGAAPARPDLPGEPQGYRWRYPAASGTAAPVWGARVSACPLPVVRQRLTGFCPVVPPLVPLLRRPHRQLSAFSQWSVPQACRTHNHHFQRCPFECSKDNITHQQVRNQNQLRNPF